MPVPAQPKIYHILHVDRLPSIIGDGYIWCDAEVARRAPPGTIIGMNRIKERRLNELTLASYPDLHVGDCVPFYFCPRSIMLYMIHKRNLELIYQGGQDPIIHLESDLMQSIECVEAAGQRWAFTLSNAGSYYFEDRCELRYLHEIDWDAVQAEYWQQCKGGKQAEFLVEHQFTWQMVSRIGVSSQSVYNQVLSVLNRSSHKPLVQVIRNSYY